MACYRITLADDTFTYAEASSEADAMRAYHWAVGYPNYNSKAIRAVSATPCGPLIK